MKKLLVFAMVALVVAYWAVRTAVAGVEFTLNNAGSEALRSVTVEVTGRSYKLGDIPPVGSKTVKLNPTAESHIELRFSTGLDLTIDCYLEPDYGGSIQAKVTSKAVVAVKNEVRLPSLF
jgi:hypothetical protein